MAATGWILSPTVALPVAVTPGMVPPVTRGDVLRFWTWSVPGFDEAQWTAAPSRISAFTLTATLPDAVRNTGSRGWTTTGTAPMKKVDGTPSMTPISQVLLPSRPSWPSRLAPTVALASTVTPLGAPTTFVWTPICTATWLLSDSWAETNVEPTFFSMAKVLVIPICAPTPGAALVVAALVLSSRMPAEPAAKVDRAPGMLVAPAAATLVAGSKVVASPMLENTSSRDAWLVVTWTPFVSVVTDTTVRSRPPGRMLLAPATIVSPTCRALTVAGGVGGQVRSVSVMVEMAATVASSRTTVPAFTPVEGVTAAAAVAAVPVPAGFVADTEKRYDPPTSSNVVAVAVVAVPAATVWTGAVATVVHAPDTGSNVARW